MAPTGPHSFVLQDIIVQLELCSLLSTSVPRGHGADTVDWKLKRSASHARRAGTAWLGLDLRQADAALVTSVRKVRACECPGTYSQKSRLIWRF